MKARTKKVWLVFHRWAGIVTGLLVIVVGITGSLLVFEDELDMALNARLLSVPVGQTALPLDMLIETAEKANEGWTPFYIARIDDAPERTFGITMSDSQGAEKQVFIDPYDGKIVGERSSLSSLALIRRLHGDLTLGAIGENALGLFSLLLMLMFVAGLILWWPAKGQVMQGLSVKVTAGSRRTLRDLHNVSGVYMFVFLFLAAITVPPIVWKLTTPDAGGPPAGQSSAPGGPPQGAAPQTAERQALPPTIPWQQAADAATAAVPGQWLGFILRPLGPQPFYLIRTFPPGENAVAKQTTIFINRYSGDVIRISAPRQFEPSNLLSADFAASLHSGAIAGLPGRYVMFLAGLIFPGLFVTGFILWLKR